MKEIYQIREDYDNGVYTHKYKFMYKKDKDFIFDENFSVKRNREMVEEYNQKVDEENRENRDKNYALYNQMRSDVVEYIMGTYDMSKEQAEKIESYAHNKEDSLYCYFYFVDELGDLMSGVMALGSV